MPSAALRRHRRSLRALLASACLLLLAIGAAPAAHAAPLGTQKQVSTVTVAPGDGTPGNPGAAYDSDLDRFLVIWSSEQESAGTIALWGRFVGADGTPLAAPFKVLNAGTATNDGLDAYDARVAYSEPLKRYFIAYRGNQSANNHEILGQWLNPDGSKNGAQLVVSDSTEYPSFPQVVPNDARGGVTAVWFGTSSSDTNNALLAATVKPGSVVKRNRLTASGSARYLFPDAAVNEQTGEFGVSFIVETGDSGNGEVGVMRLDADLNPVGAVVRPFPEGQNLTYKPTIAFSSARNEYAVAWPRRNDAHAELWVARYSATLAAVGSPVQVSSMSPKGNGVYGLQSESAIAASPTSDQWGVFWAGDILDAGHADNQYEVWGRALKGDLSDIDPQRQVSAMAPGSTADADFMTGGVAYDSTHDRWLVPWSGTLSGGTLQIFTRVVEPVRPATSALPPAAAPAPCPGQQSFTTKTGTTCAAAPVAQFQVGLAARGGTILRLLIRPTARGQRIEVRCRAHCARHARVVQAKGARKQTWISVRKAGLRRGAVVEIRVSQKGATTRYRQYRVLSRRPYLKASTGGCRVTSKQLAAEC